MGNKKNKKSKKKKTKKVMEYIQPEFPKAPDGWNPVPRDIEEEVRIYYFSYLVGYIISCYYFRTLKRGQNSSNCIVQKTAQSTTIS